RIGERFQEAMDDDFNTPEALAVLQTLAHEVNTAKAAGVHQRAAALGSELRALGQVLGLFAMPAERRKLMRIMGAKVILTPAAERGTGMKYLGLLRSETEPMRNFETP